MHTLHASNFELKIDASIDDIDCIPIISANTEAHVYVQSGAFSGAAEWTMDAVALAEFSNELMELYTLLSGRAKLTALYRETDFIEFEALKGGHIKVHGCLSTPGEDEQRLIFENHIDQTYLKCFAEGLFHEFSCYLDKKYTKHRFKNMKNRSRQI